MKFLITGGCGFLGTNLSAHVLASKQQLALLDNLSRVGSRQNFEWLRSQGAFTMHERDMRDRGAVEAVVQQEKPDAIFHLAGQVAMTVSLANPRLDFDINVLGGIHLLESVRQFAPKAAVFFSSTNKVYGDLEQIKLVETATRYTAPDYPRGFDESVPLDFHSPYGCSKGTIDQYMLDYARSFGLRTVVFRHSSVFGGRQYSTIDQGWVGWFVEKALEAKSGMTAPFTIHGDGKQVRDVLFAEDIVRCYFQALERIDQCAGQAFNIGGGMANSLSLRELFAMLEAELKVKLIFKQLDWRESDQRVFVADIAKAGRVFGFKPQIDKLTGVRKMIEWVEECRAK